MYDEGENERLGCNVRVISGQTLQQQPGPVLFLGRTEKKKGKVYLLHNFFGFSPLVISSKAAMAS